MFDFDEFGLPQNFGSQGAPVQRRPTSLEDVINRRFTPEFERLQGGQQDLEQRLLDALNNPVDFEAFRGELSALGESVSSELFGAGGAVELGLQEARGRTAETGFGTSSGGLTNATQNIFGQARNQVTDRIAQGAIDLAPIAVAGRAGDIGTLSEFTQFQGSRLDDLRESLFGGQTTIEQLRLAETTQAQNQSVIDKALQGGGGGFGGFLGAVGGGLLGSFLGPLGSAAGSRVGQSLFGGERKPV